MTICVARDLSTLPTGLSGEEMTAALDLQARAGHPIREELRHILLGKPEAIRQAIHQLHVTNYAASLLWSPITAVGDRMTLTPTQGEAMSLLKRSRYLG